MKCLHRLLVLLIATAAMVFTILWYKKTTYPETSVEGFTGEVGVPKKMYSLVSRFGYEPKEGTPSYAMWKPEKSYGALTGVGFEISGNYVSPELNNGFIVNGLGLRGVEMTGPPARDWAGRDGIVPEISKFTIGFAMKMSHTTDDWVLFKMPMESPKAFAVSIHRKHDKDVVKVMVGEKVLEWEFSSGLLTSGTVTLILTSDGNRIRLYHNGNLAPEAEYMHGIMTLGNSRVVVNPGRNAHATIYAMVFSPEHSDTSEVDSLRASLEDEASGLTMVTMKAAKDMEILEKQHNTQIDILNDRIDSLKEPDAEKGDTSDSGNKTGSVGSLTDLL